MGIMQRLSKSLRQVGFKKTCIENQPGARRTWWAGPKFTRHGIAEVLRSDGFTVTEGFNEIFGEGWSFSPPEEPDIDSDWCLSIYKANFLGHLESQGIDAMDFGN